MGPVYNLLALEFSGRKERSDSPQGKPVQKQKDRSEILKE